MLVVTRKKDEKLIIGNEIEIQVLPLQQKITDDSADKVQGHPTLIREAPKLTKKGTPLLRKTTQRIVVGHTMLHGTPL